MCLLRQENARAKVVKPKVSSRSRPRPLAAATTTDPPPAFDQTTALLASALHKSIAKVNLTQAQLRDRIGTRYERSLRERLLISLGTDKKRAFVDMADFNTYQATIRSTFRPLVEATLFDTHTSSWISFVASYGTVSLPWWSSVDVGRILDAFDRSRRLAEETALLHFEQTQMQTWLHARIEEVKARAPHFPQQLALRQLEALKTRWESPFPPDDTLLQAFEQIDISAAEEDNPGAPLTEQDHVSIFL